MNNKVTPLHTPLHVHSNVQNKGGKQVIPLNVVSNEIESPSIDMVVDCVIWAFSQSANLKYCKVITKDMLDSIVKEYETAWSYIESWDLNDSNHVPSRESYNKLINIFNLFKADTKNTINIDDVNDRDTARNTLNICDWYYFSIIAALLRNSEQFRKIVRDISYDDPKFERHIIKRINHNKRLVTSDYTIDMIDKNGNNVVKNLHDVSVALLLEILNTVPQDGFDRKDIKFMQDQPEYQQLINANGVSDSLIPHMHDCITICTHFNSSKENGLTDAQVLLNRANYGDNIMPKPTLTPVLRIILHKMIEPMMLFLIGFIVFKVILMITSKHPKISDLIGILLTIALVFGTIIVGTVQDYKAERSGNKHIKPPQQVNVIRNQQKTIINANELVVGDIIEKLGEGENIPADCRVFNPLNFSTMEAMLTGEPIDIKKNDVVLGRNTPIGNRKNMCFACTAVSTGTSSLIVTATGIKSEAGKLVEIIERTKKANQNKKTPLMESIAKLSYALIFLAVIFCSCIFFVGIGVDYNVIEILETSLSLAASAVPEGLPAILIITVAIVAKVMVNANCEIRNNSAVQTIGSISMVCSDKTGTLTLGKMTARMEDSNFKPDNKNDFIKTCLMCNSVESEKLSPKPLDNNTFSTVQDADGDTTEIAIIKMVQQSFPEVCIDLINQNTRISMCPFDSNRKRMSIIVQNNNDQSINVYTKGAPESVMEKCTMTENERREYLETNTLMTKKGIRVLGIATKKVIKSINDIKKLAADSDSDALTMYAESEMTFIGLVGIMDPPKDGVKDTVKELENAHIPTVMITGDHPNTGIAIATVLGIFKPDTHIAMTGTDFTAWSESYNNSSNNNKAELLETFKKVRVFARVTPDEKRLIVKQYQSILMVVAMLGDGPNDAPAIVEADVGYAMHSGTDLAKDNADVVILDNKLNSLTDSIRYGRSVFDNVQKFIIYLISCNFAEVFTMFFFVCFGGDLPFTTNMLLWANIFADIPPSIAISYEKPHKNIMSRIPVPREKKIISLRLFMFIFFQSILMTIYTCLAFNTISNALDYDLERSRTLAYTVLSAVQLTHTYWCRYPFEHINSFKSFIDTISSSKYVNYAVLLSFVLLIASIYIPDFNNAVGITEINGIDWLIVLCFVFVHGVLMQIVKRFMKLANVG